MKLYDQTASSPGAFDRVDQTRMSPHERRMALAPILPAELIADMLIRANADLRRVFGFIGRGISALAPRKSGGRSRTG